MVQRVAYRCHGIIDMETMRVVDQASSATGGGVDAPAQRHVSSYAPGESGSE